MFFCYTTKKLQGDSMETEMLKTAWLENEFSQNTFVVSTSNCAIIIDAGAPVERILKELGDKKPLGVFITHSHYDHILYIEDYAKALDCPIYLHREGLNFLSDPELNVSSLFTDEKTFEIKSPKLLDGGEKISLGDFEIETLHTPGHSDDSICFVIKDRLPSTKPTMFSGDTFFAKAIGRFDLPTGNPDTLLNSLNRLMEIDFDEAYTGHARKTNKAEQLSNMTYWKRILGKDQTRSF